MYFVEQNTWNKIQMLNKIEMSGCKTVRGFSIILILKEIMTF